MNDLLTLIAAELERPRPLPAQVIRHLGATYGLGRDEIGPFLDSRVADLPEDELDLLLAPLFTPKLPDQARIAGLLGGTSVASAEWPRLVADLAARPVRTELVTEDGHHHSMQVPEVALERYVRRLRLDGSVPEPRLQRIRGAFAGDAADRVIAVARRSTWDNPGRSGILDHFLDGAPAGGATPSDAEQLLSVVESYEPSGLDELRERLPRWQEILRQQIQDGGSPKPFFNHQVEELHGGGRDQRQPGGTTLDRQRAELDALERLRTLLAPRS